MKVPSAGMVPVKIWPCSKSRTSRTSRLRLCASMVTMPGMSEGRRREASSERGFSMGTVTVALDEDGEEPTLCDETAKDGAPEFCALKFCAPAFCARTEEQKRSASCWEAKVLETDSLKPRARRRVRTAASFAWVGWVM